MPSAPKIPRSGGTAADQPGVVVVEDDIRIVALNNTAVALLGGDSKDRLLDRSLADFVPPDDFEALERKLDRLFEGNHRRLG